jgi:archaemetzincin
MAGKDAKIGLVPLGKSVEEALMLFLAGRLAEVFGVTVEISARMPSPRYAYEERRGQHHSSVILTRLRRAWEGVYDIILGVTDVDLFAPPLNFVFGEADMVHQVAVISLFRLRPEIYGQPANRGLFQERALKEAVHELGHTFGLMHCGHYRCVMYFSNSLSDTDRKSHSFCRRCKDALASALSRYPR